MSLIKSFSSKLLWLIIVAIAILGVAILFAVDEKPANPNEARDFWGMRALFDSGFADAPLKSWVGLVALAAIALILAKVVIWIVQQEEWVQILTRIVQSILTAETFWLVIVALAFFGLVIGVASTNGLQWFHFVAIGAMALILAKVAVWAVRRIVDQYFV